MQCKICGAEHRGINTAINTVPTRIGGRLLFTLAGAITASPQTHKTDKTSHTTLSRGFFFRLKLPWVVDQHGVIRAAIQHCFRKDVPACVHFLSSV